MSVSTFPFGDSARVDLEDCGAKEKVPDSCVSDQKREINMSICQELLFVHQLPLLLVIHRHAQGMNLKSQACKSSV
jgi:hypothetical protein